MSEKYNLNFLEEKIGQFDKEYEYPRTSLIEGPLIYVEKNTKEDLEKELELIKQRETISKTYIWGYVVETNSIYVTRTFGENKVFIYNSKLSKNAVYVKGKLKVLKNLQKDTIDELFDQKAVFDFFYKKLWDLRLDLGKEIRNRNNIADNIALMEAQYIIDRIIFTYFICQKKLVSVKDYGPITGNELFSDIIGQLDDSWNFLKKLFFQQFAKENSEPLDCGGGVYVIAPYLNGGLFRPKNISGTSEENLTIIYEWNNIFEILNKYTWIIEDEIPDLEGDYEGNLTPEIIGHIYEKFVISISELGETNIDNLKISRSGELREIGNKPIGAYYTPEKITEHISRNIINPYIFKKLDIEEANFNSFLDRADSEILKKLLDIIDGLKICDPACGSGAFLTKAGEILLEYKTRINKKLSLPTDNYFLKKSIIINNLYGVDLKEGAIEICKLRLWLWLISSAKNHNIETLPNIEYNFHVGNSLVGWLDEKLDQNLLLSIDEKALWALDALKIGYESEQKEIIDKSIELMKKPDVRSYAKALSLLKTLYSYSAGEKAEILKNTIERIRSVIYTEINRVFFFKIMLNEKKLLLEEFVDTHPFHWKVEFNDILENGGFDVIIGNPPYGNILKKSEKDFLEDVYESTKGEIAALFVERCIKMLKETGEFGFIITYAITFRKDFSKTRKIIHDNFNQCFISSFDRDKCRFFEGMSQSVSIMLCHQKTEDSKCDFFTSKMFRITPNLSNITYQKANNYLLGKEVGVSFNQSHRLPKIGDLKTLDVIDKLVKFDKNVKDFITKKSNLNIFIRTSGNYWYNAWDQKPYQSTEVKSLDLIDGFNDIVISIMNSSIFYLWLRVYGDGRHMNRDIMDMFPMFENPIEYNYLFKLNSDRLMKYLFLNFDNQTNRFSTSNVKLIIDMSDILIGKIFGLDNKEIDHIINYETVIRGGKKLPDIFYSLYDYLLYLNKLYKKDKDIKSDLEVVVKLIELLAEEIYSDNKNIYFLVEDNLNPINNVETDEKLIIIQKFVSFIKASLYEKI